MRSNSTYIELGFVGEDGQWLAVCLIQRVKVHKEECQRKIQVQFRLCKGYSVILVKK